ncbi:Ribosomal lysine N-methyltransferase 4 [Hypoxylon texense]
MTTARALLQIIVGLMPSLLLILAIHEALFAKRRRHSLLLPALVRLRDGAAAVCYRRLYGGKLYYVEPCLFGVEGYVPLEALEALEEKLSGLRLGRLQRSTNGSPLSRNRVRHGYEAACEELRADGIVDHDYSSRAELEKAILTYPLEGIDPLEKRSKCGPDGTCVAHPTAASANAMTNSRFGDMKLSTLIDTVFMTATLFEAAGPPVALLVGGSEGGMQRALACSYDITTGTMHRETVLRLPSACLDTMNSMPRVRLGLKSPFKLRNQPGGMGLTHSLTTPGGNTEDMPLRLDGTPRDKYFDAPLQNYPVPP